MAATIGRHERGVAIVTSPAPDRRAPIAARCAAPDAAERSRDDEHAAEVPFVGVGGARRHQLAHALAREQLDVRPADLVQHRERNPDVGDDEIAAVRVGRRQDERNLRGRERHRHRRFDRLPCHLVRVGGHARRQIDRHDRHAKAVHVGDDGFEQPAQLSVEPGAEDGVDEQLALGDLAEVQLPLLRVA